jgi:hypothetical protein
MTPQNSMSVGPDGRVIPPTPPPSMQSTPNVVRPIHANTAGAGALEKPAVPSCRQQQQQPNMPPPSSSQHASTAAFLWRSPSPPRMRGPNSGPRHHLTDDVTAGSTAATGSAQ